MLAMGVNDNEGCLNERGALTFSSSSLLQGERSDYK